MGSCIKKNLGFLLKKKVSKRTIFWCTKGCTFCPKKLSLFCHRCIRKIINSLPLRRKLRSLRSNNDFRPNEKNWQISFLPLGPRVNSSSESAKISSTICWCHFCDTLPYLQKSLKTGQEKQQQPHFSIATCTPNFTLNYIDGKTGSRLFLLKIGNKDIFETLKEVAQVSCCKVKQLM
jgi:hypothetical protein